MVKGNFNPLSIVRINKASKGATGLGSGRTVNGLLGIKENLKFKRKFANSKIRKRSIVFFSRVKAAATKPISPETLRAKRRVI